MPCFNPNSKAKFAYYSRYLLASCFCITILYDEMNIFTVLVLEDLVGIHRAVQLQLLQHYWSDYSYIEWFALETNRDRSVVFEIASKYCISNSFVDHDGYSVSSEEFLPTVVDIMVI